MDKNLVLIIIFAIFVVSCKKSTEPDIVIKDPTEYIWTIDTLAYPGSIQTTMWTISGSSPTDVYVAGHNDGSFGKMYHFDGKKWEPVNFQIPIGDFYDIWVFSANDIWAVGEHSRWEPNYTPYTQSIHYNGHDWQEVGTPKKGRLASVWGNHPGDLWSCGTDKVYHFGGSEWQEVSIPLPAQEIQFGRIRGLSANNVYATCLKNDMVPPIDTTFYYLYHFNGQIWSIMDSALVTSSNPQPYFGSYLAVIDGVLYSAGQGVFRLENEHWIVLNQDLALSRIAGSSLDNIYASGALGTIYHFDGSGWRQLNPIPGFNHFIGGIWTNAMEVFFVATDGERTYIIHGK
ncbi:MAG: hypothetical protein HUU32_16635 [Calditrichaceae bacterium]|nr:hypothetical protein [Calditrichia bacterium]NUQ43018.1 hypothetical protein [Calditrichaceae bacterium]